MGRQTDANRPPGAVAQRVTCSRRHDCQPSLCALDPAAGRRLQLAVGLRAAMLTSRRLAVGAEVTLKLRPPVLRKRA